MRVREWVWVDRGRQRDRVISCASCAGSRLNFQQRKGFLLFNIGLNSAKRQLTFKWCPRTTIRIVFFFLGISHVCMHTFSSSLSLTRALYIYVYDAHEQQYALRQRNSFCTYAYDAHEQQYALRHNDHHVMIHFMVQCVYDALNNNMHGDFGFVHRAHTYRAVRGNFHKQQYGSRYWLCAISQYAWRLWFCASYTYIQSCSWASYTYPRTTIWIAILVVCDATGA